MENMSAWKLLWGCIRPVGWLRGGYLVQNHFLSTNNAGSISHRHHFFFGGVGITLVHIFCGSFVAMQCTQTCNERSGGNVNIPDDVKW